MKKSKNLNYNDRDDEDENYVFERQKMRDKKRTKNLNNALRSRNVKRLVEILDDEDEYDYRIKL